jgi:Ser/Thr protein kinase RdoA (MazF antagonist)
MTLPHDMERQLQEKAKTALSLWGIGGEPVLLKYRENAVFRTRLPDGRSAALRLHRPNYHREEALRAELDFSAYLASDGLNVPQPIPARDGSLFVVSETSADGTRQFASLVSWMDGAPLGRTGIPLDLPPKLAIETFHRLGSLFATLHASADRYPHPPGFMRPRWDLDGLLGEAPLWGRFWDCPGLDPRRAAALTRLREDLLARLQGFETHTLDFGLIHADGVRENIMLSGGVIGLIDFDDFGFGFRLFELATALFKNREEACYLDLEAALLDGYGRNRPLPARAAELLNLFTVLRSLTYIGWAAARPEMAAKVERYADEALTLATALG